MYKNSTGPSPCEDCPANMLSPAGSVSSLNCSCIPGFFHVSEAVCEVCPPDTYQALFGADSCAECPPNSVSPAASAYVVNCTCDVGFDGEPGMACGDVDECTTGAHSCDVNAGCTNTTGSFTCTCLGQYAGNGTFCSDAATLTPVVNLPPSNVTLPPNFVLEFVLPETASPGSVTLSLECTTNCEGDPGTRLVSFSVSAAGVHRIALPSLSNATWIDEIDTVAPEVDLQHNSTYRAILSYQDSFNNPTAVAVVVNLLIDSEAIAPILLAPASGTVLSRDFLVEFILPEAPSNGSTRLYFILDDGSFSLQRTVFLSSTAETVGRHAFVIPSLSLAALSSPEILLVEPELDLEDAQSYGLVVAYTDSVGNTVAAPPALGLLYDAQTLAAVLYLNEGDVLVSSQSIAFLLPEAARADSVSFLFNSSTAEPLEVRFDTEFNDGEHIIAVDTIRAALFSAGSDLENMAVYDISLEYGDLAGNLIAATVVGNVTYDQNECWDSVHNCHMNASCTNSIGSFECTCDVGFSGDGTSCADQDECKLMTDDCAPAADCTNSAGSFSCDCWNGYTGSGTNCTDLDECGLATHDCHEMAYCENTQGSFICDCVLGYDGSGTLCREVDECEVGLHNCAAGGSCANTMGSFTCACGANEWGDGVDCASCAAHGASSAGSVTSSNCTCNLGFVGDGHTTCSDFDECAATTHNCDLNASCTNTLGSFVCFCETGFYGDGLNCTACAAHATASAASGSATDCVCNSGYSGEGHTACLACSHGSYQPSQNSSTCLQCPDGYTTLYEASSSVSHCIDSRECYVEPTGCPFNSSCVDTVGSFTCFCDVGYASNGQTCTNIDECSDTSCGLGGMCVDTFGSYTCDCDAGFILDNGVCEDMDECIGQPCHISAQCNNTDGGFKCICNAGYYGDGVSCSACPTNTFKATSSNDDCIACREFSSASDTGRTEDCPCILNYRDVSGLCVPLSYSLSEHQLEVDLYGGLIAFEILTLENLASAPLPFVVSDQLPDWVSLTPRIGEVPAFSSAEITIRLDTSTLLGDYAEAAIDLVLGDNISETLSVSMQIVSTAVALVPKDVDLTLPLLSTTTFDASVCWQGPSPADWAIAQPLNSFATVLNVSGTLDASSCEAIWFNVSSGTQLGTFVETFVVSSGSQVDVLSIALTVTPGSVSPTQSDVLDSSESSALNQTFDAIAGDELYFYIEARDTLDNFVTYPPWFDVVVLGPGGSSSFSAREEFILFLEKSGWHAVTVSYDGVPLGAVDGATFGVHVSAGAMSLLHSKLYLNNATCTFEEPCFDGPVGDVTVSFVPLDAHGNLLNTSVVTGLQPIIRTSPDDSFLYNLTLELVDIETATFAESLVMATPATYSLRVWAAGDTTPPIYAVAHLGDVEASGFEIVQVAEAVVPDSAGIWHIETSPGVPITVIVEAHDNMNNSLPCLLPTSLALVGIDECDFACDNDRYSCTFMLSTSGTVVFTVEYDATVIMNGAMEVSVFAGEVDGTLSYVAFDELVCSSGKQCTSSTVGTVGPQFNVVLKDAYDNFVLSGAMRDCTFSVSEANTTWWEYCSNTTTGYALLPPVREVGNHEINVVVGGDSVIGSGFILYVSPSDAQEADGRMSYITVQNDDCLTGSVCSISQAGADITFSWTAKDRFGDEVMPSSVQNASVVVSGTVFAADITETSISGKVFPTMAGWVWADTYLDGGLMSNSGFLIVVHPTGVFRATVISIDMEECLPDVSCTSQEAGGSIVLPVTLTDEYENSIRTSTCDALSASAECVESALEVPNSWVVLASSTSVGPLSLQASFRTENPASVVETSFQVTITQASTSAETSYGAAENALTAGETWTVEVTGRDAYDNALNEVSNYRFGVALSNPSGSTVVEVVTLPSNNVELAELQLTTSGLWSAVVSYLGADVGMHLVDVAPGSVFAPFCTAVLYSNGSPEKLFAVGTGATLAVTVLDAFGNSATTTVDSSLLQPVSQIDLCDVFTRSEDIFESTCQFDSIGLFDITVLYDGETIGTAPWQVVVLSTGQPVAAHLLHGEETCTPSTYCPLLGWQSNLALTYIVELVDEAGVAVEAPSDFTCLATSPSADLEIACVDGEQGYTVQIFSLESDDYSFSVEIAFDDFVEVIPLYVFLANPAKAEALSLDNSYVLAPDCSGQSCECVHGTQCGSSIAAGSAPVYILQLQTVDDNPIPYSMSVGVLSTLRSSEATVYVVGRSIGVGQFSLPLTSEVPGRYSVTVTVDGVAIGDDTVFTIEVIAGDASVAMSSVASASGEVCKTDLQCGNAVVAGNVALYSVDANDQYGNPAKCGGFVELETGETLSIDEDCTFEIAGVAGVDTSVVVSLVAESTGTSAMLVRFLVQGVASVTAADSSFVAECVSFVSPDICLTFLAAETSRATIVPCDEFGNCPSSPITGFEASSNSEALSTSLVSDDSVVLDMYGTVPGDYIVTVMYENDLVTTFAVTVEPGAANAMYSDILVETAVVCPLQAECLSEVAGTEVMFFVQARDIFGNTLSRSYGQQVASSFVFSQNGDSYTWQETIMEDTDDGMYQVSEILTIAGSYEFSARIDDNELQNSPTMVAIRPSSAVDPSRSSILTDVYWTSIAGESSLRIILRDPYGNDLADDSAVQPAYFDLNVGDAFGTAFSTNDPSEYEITVSQTLAGAYVASLTYNSINIPPGEWWVTVLPGAVEASKSLIYLGENLCLRDSLCRCSLIVGEAFRFELRLFDSFGNEATNAEPGVVYTLSGLGVSEVALDGNRQPNGRYSIPVQQQVVATYIVAVYVNGIPVEESPILCEYEPRPDLGVNATLSYVTWVDATHSRQTPERCLDFEYCGYEISLPSHPEARGYTAGEDGLDLRLIQVNDFGVQVNESSGIISTFALINSERQMFTVLTGVATLDGTYELKVTETQSGDWQVRAILGSKITADFFITVAPAEPYGPASQLSETWYGGAVCEVGVVCFQDAAIAGDWSGVLAVTVRDRYWNQAKDPVVGGFAISGLDGLSGQQYVDYGNGTATIQINSTVSGQFAVQIYVDSISTDNELLGSGFVFEVDAASAAASSSACVNCASGRCDELCVRDSNCPDLSSDTGSLLTYSVDMFDVYDNAVVLGEGDSSLFSLEACLDSTCTMVGSQYDDTYGRFVFQHNSTRAGLYSVRVAGSGGDDLRNSPFKVRVLAGAPSPAFSEVWTPAANPTKRCEPGIVCFSMVAAEEGSLVVIPFDQYLNEWVCSGNDCNFNTQDYIFAQVTTGSQMLPLVLPDATGRFPVTFDLTAARDWEVSVGFFAETSGTTKTLADSGFYVRVSPSVLYPSLSRVHNCVNASSEIMGCECRSGVVCTSVVSGETTPISIRLLDRFGNAVSSRTAQCDATAIDYSSACESTDDIDLPLPLYFTTAGEYTVSVLLADESVSMTAVGNSGFMIAVVPGVVSELASEVYISDGLYFDLCAADSKCGSDSVPGRETFVLISLRDEFRNVLTSEEPIPVQYYSVPSMDDVEIATGGLNVTEGAGEFALTHNVVGSYTIFVLVDGRHIAASGFYVSCATLKLGLYFDLIVELGNDGTLDNVAEELPDLLAEALLVPVSRLNFTSADYLYDATAETETEYNTSVIASAPTERRMLAMQSYYRVGMVYYPVSTTDLSATEQSVIELDTTSLSGEGFQTTAVDDVDDNTVEVVAQVDPELTQVYANTGEHCTTNSFCPSLLQLAGDVVNYTMQVSDIYGNAVNVDMEWTCVLSLWINEVDICTGSSRCWCEPDFDRAGLFIAEFEVTALDESLMDRVGEVWSYSLEYEVHVELANVEVASSGFTLEVGPANETSPERSLLVWENATPLTVVAGASTVFTVQSRDEFGNLRPTSSDKWRATLTLESVPEEGTIPELTEFVIMLVPDSHPGEYLLMLDSLQLAATYKVNFALSGQQNSTIWSLNVIPAPTDPAMCIVSVEGVDENYGFQANDGRDHRLIIDAFDSFGNRQTEFDTFLVTYKFFGKNLTANLQLPFVDLWPGHYERPFAAQMDEIGYVQVDVTLYRAPPEPVTTLMLLVQCPVDYVEVDESYLGWKDRFDDDGLHPNYCEVCPIYGANCDEPGQSLAHLQHDSGYWRSSVNSLDFVLCLNRRSYYESSLDECGEVGQSCEACMNITVWEEQPRGGDEWNVGGQCRLGYRSRLCSLCEPGYSRNYDFECSLCASRNSVIFRLLLYLLIMFAYVGLLILVEYATAVKDPAPGSALKIVTHYLQMSTFIQLFGLNDYKRAFFYEPMSKITAPLSEELTMDCIFYHMDITENLYVNRLRSVAILPILLVAVIVSVIWLLHMVPTLLRRKTEQMAQYRDFRQTDAISLREFREGRGRSLENLQGHAIAAAGLQYIRDHMQPKVAAAAKKVKLRTGAVPRADVWSSESIVRTLPYSAAPPTIYTGLGSVGVEMRRRQMRHAEQSVYYRLSLRRTIWLATLIVILFVHPTVTSANVQIFQCLSIPMADGTYRSFLKQDLEIECWTRDHAYAVPMGVLSLCVYIFGIPICCAFILYYFRSNLRAPPSTTTIRQGRDATCIAAPRRVPGLAVGSADGTVTVFPVATCGLASLHETIAVASSVTSLSFISLRENAIEQSAPAKSPRSPASIETARIKSTPKSTKGATTSVMQALLVGRGDGVVDVYRVMTKSACSLLCSLTGHMDAVVQLVVSENGFAASASKDGSIRLWDVCAARCVEILRTPSQNPLVAMNQSGTAMVHLYSETQVILTDRVFGGSKMHSVIGHGKVTALAVSPLGTRFAVSWADGSTRVFSMTNQSELRCLVGVGGACSSLSFVPGLRGEALAFTGFSILGVWEFDRNMVTRKQEFQESPSNFVCDVDGLLYHCLSANGDVIQWSPFKESSDNRLRRYTLEHLLGFLYFGYKPQYYLWEFVIIARKTMIVTMAMVANDRFEVGFRIMGILIISILLQMVCQPFSKCIINNKWSRFSYEKGSKTVLLRPVLKNTLNDMEVASLTVSLFNLTVGLYTMEGGDAFVPYLAVPMFFVNSYILIYFALSLYAINTTALKYRYIPMMLTELGWHKVLARFLAWRAAHDDKGADPTAADWKEDATSTAPFSSNSMKNLLESRGNTIAPAHVSPPNPNVHKLSVCWASPHRQNKGAAAVPAPLPRFPATPAQPTPAVHSTADAGVVTISSVPEGHNMCYRGGTAARLYSKKRSFRSESYSGPPAVDDDVDRMNRRLSSGRLRLFEQST
eukprot:Rmarinus@m.552